MAESGPNPGSTCADASSSSSSSSSSSLRDKLAAVLPEGFRFGIHHLSTPPTKTDALCSPPPGERPDRTYCERHFLAVSIRAAEAPRPEKPENPEKGEEAGRSEKPEDHAPQEHVLVLGVEVFLYTTAHSTTLFVSKADSTGYLHRLGLPRGAPSPIREVCAAFVRDLVEQRRRRGVPLVVSLFARAQDQYLFPGSIECGGKHILDDRGLVRWWCRVLDGLVRAPPRGGGGGGGGLLPAWRNARGYLVVPGLDAYEARALVPRRADATSTSTSTTATAWAVNEDPLERISHYHREFDWVPPRCLIPRFPDDPKSRFRDELDSEADRTGGMRKTGSWRTVKTLGMFWEMMAFRQECSSGRMTGFIWVVFDDLEDEKTAKSRHVGKGEDAGEGEVRQRTPKENALDATAAAAAPQTPTTQRITNVTPSTTPRRLFPRKGSSTNTGSDNGRPAKSRGDEGARKPSRAKTHSSASKHKKRRARLRGVIVPRQPRIKTKQRNYLLERPVSTPYYLWPAQGRGARIVVEADYKRILELLMHLDFSTLDKAVSSTGRWVSEAGLGGRRGGYDVVGTREVAARPAGNGLQEGGVATTAAGEWEGAGAVTATVNNLSGLVKRKRAETVGEGEVPRADERGSKVNVLSGGLVRRKRKDQEGSDGGAEARGP